MCKPATVTNPVDFACPLPAGVTSVPDCSAAIGYLNYSVGSASVATINTNTNQITANAPGTTPINASVAGSGSSAGYFSTCPPQSIGLTLANGATSGTVTRGVQQNLITTVLDTRGLPVNGLSLDYQSTNPIDISVSSSGGVTPRFPGVASVFAVCQPSSCNYSPINELGFNGTGLSIASNPVNITTPGTISDFVWFAAPGKSQYFVPVELLTGTIGSTVRLPYVPNSMVMDQSGSNLYFGSERELMIYSTASNSIAKQDTGAPGVVLAVSPDNAQVLINDQVRQLFYLYNASAGGFTTFGGLGNAAAWTPDSKTLYITDNAALNNPPFITGHTDKLYVYNQNTGWSTYPLPPSPLPAGSIPPANLPGNVAVSSTMQTPALTIPSIGAYLRGGPDVPGTPCVAGQLCTVARTWCPSGTVGNAASMTLYPQGDSVLVQSDVLTATTDGKHILTAAPALVGSGITLSDIAVNVPSSACPIATAGSTQTLSALTIQHPTPYTQASVNVNATAINQLVASPVSNLAFVLYNGASANAQLPYYIPGSNGAPGTVGYVALKGAASITAPLAGAFTPDDSIFFVSTAGDNQIHYISIPANPATTPPTDTQQISPNLPACTPVSAGGQDAGCSFSGTGTIVPATAIAVIPRSTT
jgi:sugar lactone lactonase YvrE